MDVRSMHTGCLFETHPFAQRHRSGGFATYSFTCRYEKCSGSCSFSKPEGFELYTPEMKGGRWMKKEYVF